MGSHVCIRFWRCIADCLIVWFFFLTTVAVVFLLAVDQRQWSASQVAQAVGEEECWSFFFCSCCCQVAAPSPFFFLFRFFFTGVCWNLSSFFFCSITPARLHFVDSIARLVGRGWLWYSCSAHLSVQAFCITSRKAGSWSSISCRWNACNSTLQDMRAICFKWMQYEQVGVSRSCIFFHRNSGVRANQVCIQLLLQFKKSQQTSMGQRERLSYGLKNSAIWFEWGISTIKGPIEWVASGTAILPLTLSNCACMSFPKHVVWSKSTNATLLQCCCADFTGHSVGTCWSSSTICLFSLSSLMSLQSGSLRHLWSAMRHLGFFSALSRALIHFLAPFQEAL